MQKIIVTGGLGFIGSNLIELLLKNNYYVINIDKVSYSSNYYNTKEFDNNNYKFIKCDINNGPKIRKFRIFFPKRAKILHFVIFADFCQNPPQNGDFRSGWGS